MLCRLGAVHGCDPGIVSEGSRLALIPNSLYRVPFFFGMSALLSSGILCALFVLLFLSFRRFCLVFFSCSRWSFVIDVPLIFSCPADHVPDWQPSITGYG